MTVVVGIDVSNEVTARVVRVVMVLSVLTAAIVVLQRLVLVAYTDKMDILWTIPLGLMVPACGYFGAKRRCDSSIHFKDAD
jgi:hypothetical protein